MDISSLEFNFYIDGDCDYEYFDQEAFLSDCKQEAKEMSESVLKVSNRFINNSWQRGVSDVDILENTIGECKIIVYFDYNFRIKKEED